MESKLPPDFPSFEQSSFGQYYAAAVAAGVFKDEAQKLSCLRLAKGIYHRTRLRAMGLDPDLPDGGRGVGLPG